MSGERERLVGIEPLRSDIHIKSPAPVGSSNADALRALAARGIDKPETLSPEERERICTEVIARLDRKTGRLR